MRSKIGIGVLGVAMAFLLATHPAVVNAAGQIGSSGIKNNSVKSKDIKDNQLKSADIKDGSLTGTDIDESSLVGFAQASQPAFTPVTMNAGYTQFAGGTTPGYMKDSLGFVHLKGMMNCPGSGTAFSLPPGFAPAQRHFFPLAVGVTGAGNVQITSDGAVSTFHADGAAHACGLDGITFRTDTVGAKGTARNANN